MRGQYTPESDEEVLTICGTLNEEAGVLNIDQTLFYSASSGFYLMSRHGQVKKEERWITAQFDDLYDDIDGEDCTANRRIITVFRSMTQNEALLWILDSSMPIGTRAKKLLLSTYSALIGGEIPS